MWLRWSALELRLAFMPGQLCCCLGLLAWYGSTSQGLSAAGVHRMVLVSLYITRCIVLRIQSCKVCCRSMLKAQKRS